MSGMTVPAASSDTFTSLPRARVRLIHIPSRLEVASPSATIRKKHLRSPIVWQ